MKKFSSLLRPAGVSLEVKASSAGHIEGYASTFNAEPDLHGEIVRPGAFANSLRKHKAAGTFPVMLWSHRMEHPIGRWTGFEEDTKGLYAKGQLNLETHAGREAFKHLSAGDVTGLSIGFLIEKDGREYQGDGVFLLKKLDLLEVSAVAIPANPKARITQAKSLKSRSDAVALLRDSGLSKAAAKKFAAGGWPALNGNQDEENLQKFAAEIDAATRKVRGL